MCRVIEYRGPDEEGIWDSEKVALGMRRLSIIDLAGGQQPIFNEDRSVATVFNGEIYNFQTLRAELLSAGHRFSTSSDTEVIVHLYEQYGTDFPRWLRGMFGIAVWDLRAHKLILARDRFGKKPLHYAPHAGGLLFASEIKSILAVAPGLAQMDVDAIHEYLYYGYVPDPNSAFGQIKKLPPGHVLEYSGSDLCIRKYWDLPESGTYKLSEAEALDRLETELSEAVRLRLISEVPLGALLSGGVDSSVVVGMMARSSSMPVKTFCISFAHEQFNEASHAAKVAQAFGTEHRELRIESDAAGTLAQIGPLLDEPFADSSIIPTYEVSRLAKRFVTVALSGDGGDELFAGYDHYPALQSRRHYDLIPEMARNAYLRHAYPHLPQWLRRKKLAYNVALNARDRFIDARSLRSLRDLDPITPTFRATVQQDLPARCLQRYFDNAPAADLVARMQYADIKTYMTADVLTKVDRMSMAASLEVRSPLLDHVLAEFVTSLPTSLKLNSRSSKFLLKKLAERIGVPRDVLYRRKQGFSVPLAEWLRSVLRDTVADVLLSKPAKDRGITDTSVAERMLREHWNRNRDHSLAIWQVFMLELWASHYLDRMQPALKTERDTAGVQA